MFKLISCRSRSQCIVGLILLLASPLSAQDAPEKEESTPAEKATVVQRSPSDLPAAEEEIMFDLASVPQVEEGKFVLPPLAAPTIATEQVGNGRVPEGIRDDDFAVHPLPESAEQRMEGWNWTLCEWEAANTFSNPRYFEDRMLERHGHERFGHFQSAASGVRFVGSVAMLPYLMTLSPGCECEYTLGYYRPGSQVPGFLQRPPYDRDAAIIQSAAASGVMIIFP